ARSLTIIDRLFVPDDTYYTLTIARSMAHGHGPTTDGSTLTSGFQPLLGFVMTPVFLLTNSADAALRVDMLFLVLADTATIAVQFWCGPRRQLISAAAAFAVVAGPWWVWCTVALGTPVPTSGPAAHKLAPYPSFSKTTTSLAVGAVSGGPFQPWDWFRSRVL